MTACIAEGRPIAVVTSASAIHGATTASDAKPAVPMPVKAFIILHTVPKRLTKGVVEPVVGICRTFISIWHTVAYPHAFRYFVTVQGLQTSLY